MQRDYRYDSGSDSSYDWSTVSEESASSIPSPPREVLPDIDDSPSPNHGSNGQVEAVSFPQFKRLSEDLQLYIWEAFCLEYIAHPLALEFIVQATPENVQYHTVYDTEYLRYSTQGIRKILAVCHDCRAIVTRTLTDTLTFRASKNHSLEGVVRFRPGRDLVFLSDFAPIRGTQVLYHLPNFAKCVQNVAAVRRSIKRTDGRCLSFLASLSNLGNVYVCRIAISRSQRNKLDWKWFMSTSCYQRRRDFGREISIYCWPKLNRESEIPDTPIRMERRLLTATAKAAARDWNILPMVIFEGLSGIEDYNLILNTELDPETDFSTHSDTAGNSDSYASTRASYSTRVGRRWRRERRWKRTVEQQAEQRRIHVQRAERRAGWVLQWQEQQLKQLNAELLADLVSELDISTLSRHSSSTSPASPGEPSDLS